MTTMLNTQNDLRALSAQDIDAVAGAATVKLFDITVAGMRVVGTANLDTGHYATWVQSGDNLVIRGGKV